MADIRVDEPEKRVFRPSPILARLLRLLHSSATALDQDDQHDHKEYAGDNPDERCTIHCDSPFLNFGTYLRMCRKVECERPILICVT